MRILDSHGVLYQYTDDKGLQRVDSFSFTPHQSDKFLEGFIEEFKPPKRYRNIHKNALDYINGNENKFSDYIFIEYLLLYDIIKNKKKTIGIELINERRYDMDSVIVSSAHIAHSELIGELLGEQLRIKGYYHIHPKSIENWEMAFRWIYEDFERNVTEVIDDRYANTAYQAAKERGNEIRIFTSL